MTTKPQPCEDTLKAGDVMSIDPAAVSAETTVSAAMRMMLERRVSGLPVTDAHGALLGIVTEGDFLHRGELGTEKRRPRWIGLLTSPGKLAGEYTGAHALRVGEIMTTDLHTATPDTPLTDVVRAMEKYRVKRLPVIADNRLVGIVSRADLMRAFLTRLPDTMAATTSDTALRERIAAEIDRQAWGPSALVHVSVNRGVATLNGVLVDERMRVALRVLAENICGAGKVRDRLTTIEPMTGAVVSSADD
ncbi:MAG: CBS domain-containing protein [Xanthomonadaceae bacterium]|nr:CBS domain-containing protein [Xanthomonadaceae bacterium]MDE2256284.1 CBS domain-containing protein [Xanthomonadaceae bacterium]